VLHPRYGLGFVASLVFLIVLTATSAEIITIFLAPFAIGCCYLIWVICGPFPIFCPDGLWISGILVPKISVKFLCVIGMVSTIGIALALGILFEPHRLMFLAAGDALSAIPVVIPRPRPEISEGLFDLAFRTDFVSRRRFRTARAARSRWRIENTRATERTEFGFVFPRRRDRI
jgi:hypothetical protein